MRPRVDDIVQTGGLVDQQLWVRVAVVAVLVPAQPVGAPLENGVLRVELRLETLCHVGVLA